MEDAERGVVVAGDGDCAVVQEHQGIKPNEEAIF